LTGAFLSFLWPGLGQLYEGDRRRALLHAVPIFVLVAFLAIQLVGGIEGFGVSLLDPTFSLLLLVLAALAGLWRLVSMVDAFRARPAIGWRRTRASLVAFAVLAAVVVGVHAYAGYVAWSFYDASQQIFVADNPGGGGTSSALSPTPVTSVVVGATNTPQPTPTATPDPRLTVLLLGVDSGENRDHALTDTMLVVTVDLTTHNAVMLSIPRDTSDFPMYSGGTYTAKLNSLMSTAASNPARYPDGPVRTLENEIGYLLGIPIDYYASINLDGFRTMVDAVGGIDVVNPKPIADPTYGDFPSRVPGFYLSAGLHHLDGWTALAYVRSRKGIGDSDFTRAARQQQVIVALKNKLTTPAMIVRIPALLKAAAAAIRTDVPRSQLNELLAIAKSVSDKSIKNYVLGPPYEYNPPMSQTNGVYTLVLYMDKLKALSIDLFGRDSAYWSPPPPSPSPGG
jgi:polyisoprenyl-teichoic acid--peptidoglycan teichoic acid transferase